MLEPIDIAETFLHLASDGAKYVTGQAIVVDAGWSIMLHLPTSPGT
jgi:NAD(P)-dependent dehydrogenase (short-subunit alcohol dehydrogenase family)